MAQAVGFDLPLPEEHPAELSTQRAAEALGVSKDTVLRLKKAGLLEWRNAAPPTSARPVFRFSKASVERLRTSYETDEPVSFRPKESKRHRAKNRPAFKHVRYAE